MSLLNYQVIGGSRERENEVCKINVVQRLFGVDVLQLGIVCDIFRKQLLLPLSTTQDI